MRNTSLPMHVEDWALSYHHVCMQVNTNKVIRKVQFLMLPWLWLMVVSYLLRKISGSVLCAAAILHTEPTSFKPRTEQLAASCTVALSHASAACTLHDVAIVGHMLCSHAELDMMSHACAVLHIH